jgi:outer membrane protein OmpA-like peptidoglycan-associated protein
MMKRNMPFITLVLAVLCLNANRATAQDRSYEGTITIVPVRLEQLGETVHIDFDILMKDVKVKSAHGVDLIPQLASPTTTYELPRVSLKGKNEYLVHERRLAVMSAKAKKNYKAPYLIEKNQKKKSGVIRYRYTLPYEPWMADAGLNVQRDECGCGESALMNVEHTFDKVTLERMLVPYVVTPHLSYVEPKVEEIKSRDIQAECFLDFEVNKVDIRPEYMSNPQELAKIRAMIDDLKSDANVNVKRLDIIGYASPEGTLAANKRLSEGRAMALRNYLAARYDFPRNQYYIIFGGENWDGLVKALDTFEMEYKAEVLDIITNIPIEKGRETKLMQLRGGAPYRLMLKEIFPSLRVAICKVSYDVRNFNLEEAKEVIKKRPQNLSLNEMFMVANAYPKGSQEFIDVFETAVRIYPESEVAAMNAATAALSRNDLVSAERYLERVKSDDCLPEYNNAMGVLLLMKGEYELSEKYLRTAAQSGLDAAKENLEELAKKKANALKIKGKNKNE